jgi:hypothetical protein
MDKIRTDDDCTSSFRSRADRCNPVQSTRTQHTQTHDLTQAAATAGAMQRLQHIHYIILSIMGCIDEQNKNR